MGELVKYHNEVNRIPLRNFNEKEINLFFSIIHKVKDIGTEKIELDFIELKKLALTGREDKRLITSLKNMNNKLLDLKQEIILPDGKIVMFNLFNTFMIDPVEKNMMIQINENFIYMINDLFEHFTGFELTQLVELKSSYSKNLFRLLKQWESTCYFIIDLAELKTILCVPNSYKMCDIDKRILKPVLKELTPIFPRLKIKKIKKGRGVDKLEFTWGNRNILNGEIAPGVQPKKVMKIEISEELNQAIEKIKKNRYIKPMMTNKNIEKLIKKYTDQELIKGLNFAYKEIKTEIKSVNYLIKTIDTGLEETEIKIVVKKVQSKDLQGINTKEEKKKELREEIREPKNEELKEFMDEVRKIGRKQLKDIEYYKFMGELQLCMNFEVVNELILKYKLNEVL